MSDLATWASRVFATVEQDGASTAKVRLVTAHDGQTWQTWFAPFPSVDDWVLEVNAFLRTLEQEWPARVVAIAFLAESKTNEVLSQLPGKVTGKARTGQLDSQAAATSLAFDTIAVTIEKLQRLVNTQLDAARRTAESNSEMIHQQTQLISLYRQQEMMGEGSASGLEKLLESHGEDIFGLVNAFAQTLSQKGIKKQS